MSALPAPGMVKHTIATLPMPPQPPAAIRFMDSLWEKYSTRMVGPENHDPTCLQICKLWSEQNKVGFWDDEFRQWKADTDDGSYYNSYAEAFAALLTIPTSSLDQESPPR